VITAVDTNVLLDVFGADPRFGGRSAAALRQCLAQGAVVACEAVWAETATSFETMREFTQAMRVLDVAYSALEEDAALRAAEAWRRYRTGGSKRDRVVADFLIGAHAMTQADRLLTRDRGFYRGYFKGLAILDPSA
jgi:hypothetical protein